VGISFCDAFSGATEEIADPFPTTHAIGFSSCRKSGFGQLQERELSLCIAKQAYHSAIMGMIIQPGI
jgi:hypothetical protein